MKDTRLTDAINSGVPGNHMSTWHEIKDYYQDTHSSHKWIGQLVQDWTGLTPANKREYNTARRRVERWADGTNKPGKASIASLAELGKRLKPKSYNVPSTGIDITVKGEFYVSKKDGKRYREIKVHLEQMQALEYLDNPSYEAIFEEYGVDGDMFAGGMDDNADVEFSV